MDIAEAIRSRKSIRSYKPNPVPQKILSEILGVAVRAPSALNTQPWEFTVITGEPLNNIKKRNVELLNSGTIPSPDVPGAFFDGVYKQRQVDLAIQIFQLMGIAREDKEKRAEWMQWGFKFFDAPAVIVIAADKALNESQSSFDVGTVVQTTCLAALSHGLGTCIQGQGVMYPQIIRKFTGLPESKRIITCIAIGYPDWDFPANKLESAREQVENITTWCGFD